MLPVDSDLLKGAVACFVIDMFVDCVGYKGHTPRIATLVHQDRTRAVVH